ncbi:TetR/AcrR family transcriptional regulator [Amycolatopsis rhabdoformis]|uniref:TetR/AcrR family transcriptional regulator n=1 Tax=Amycolatopsis rhabdoformis TaxID=1448059 RepID=A0ABZ1IIS6_9PSEU|nr:TetR/AcrR family transcriptional regulator [Amycolatopsis rhabdoformis]WSE33686.1 TetR/AcrR family transcriptional regulator [Amycolatopsis rhabdoformis]
MGRTSDAKERILAAAHELVEVRGYSALGVAEICKAAGVPKGSFYYFFESKEALALAVIAEEWAGQRKGWAEALEGPGAPLAKLRKLFEGTAAAQRQSQATCGTVSGCLFGNLSLELSNRTEPIRLALQEVFATQARMVQAVVEDAVARGDALVADPAEAARAVVAQLEGQVLLAKLYNDTSHLDAMWTNCLALVGAGVAEAAAAMPD